MSALTMLLRIYLKKSQQRLKEDVFDSIVAYSQISGINELVSKAKFPR
jgi:hypothetical protein